MLQQTLGASITVPRMPVTNRMNRIVHAQYVCGNSAGEQRIGMCLFGGRWRTEVKARSHLDLTDAQPRKLPPHPIQLPTAAAYSCVLLLLTC